MKITTTVVLFLAYNVLASPTFPPPDPGTPSSKLYVDPSGAHIYPFADWATAATNIQDAVDAAVDGDTVMVGDGHYLLSEQIVVSNEITIQSLNGPEVTVVDGGNATRCFHLGSNACVVSGLTITKGNDQYPTEELWEEGGGGVYCVDTTPIVKNCIVTRNKSAIGGGIYRGTAIDTTIHRNGDSRHGEKGGGIYKGHAIRCIISNNFANDYGAKGGGLYNSTAINCLISGNYARDGGGGGMYGGTAINCTIVNNSIYDYRGGAGMFYGTAINCIFADNDLLVCDDDEICTGGNYYGSVVHYSYSHYTITNAQIFVDSKKGDYRLLATSPCVDSGSNGVVTTAVDLDGNERIIDGNFDGVPTVDMGAYEFQATMIPADCIQIPPISLKSKGRTLVTILSNQEFDASAIDPASVRFAGAAPVHIIPNDIDGDTELKLLFMTADLDINAGGEVTLMAQTYDGVLVVGVDTVKLVPAK